MKIKKLFLFLSICFVFIGCGKENEETKHSYSKWEVNKGFTEDALLYRNSDTRRMEYFDYQTGHYGPLCGKPNCLHNDSECMAYYLGRVAYQMGRLGDKWYYLKDEDLGLGRMTFCSCDLNGANEKDIGEFSHWISYKSYFYEDSCIFLTEEPVFDAKREECLGYISGIYQYHMDTGEAEMLCPEKEIMKKTYELYGQYEDLLIYGEWVDEGLKLRIMDLKTWDIQMPLENMYLFDGIVNENLFACNIKEGEIYKTIEFNLESGEWKEIMDEKEKTQLLCWSSDLKFITVLNDADDSMDFHYEVYQYTEDGECVLVREGNRETYMEPVAIKDNLIIGRYGDAGDARLIFDLAVISKEDFLAGNCNWRVLQY